MLRCARVFNSVNALHVLLHACALIRWTRFMLRCACVCLNSGEHTSCYVARVCCTSVTKLHVTCALLSFFGDQTSRYIARFCLSSVAKKLDVAVAPFFWSPVNTLHVTLRASAALQWTRFMLGCARCVFYFGEHASRFAAARVCCTSVTKLHIALRTSVVLRWTHFMLRCALLLVL